ncbi:hypothetical protein D3C80_1176440 [compost metagenome]
MANQCGTFGRAGTLPGHGQSCWLVDGDVRLFGCRSDHRQPAGQSHIAQWCQYCRRGGRVLSVYAFIAAGQNPGTHLIEHLSVRYLSGERDSYGVTWCRGFGAAVWPPVSAFIGVVAVFGIYQLHHADAVYSGFSAGLERLFAQHFPGRGPTQPVAQYRQKNRGVTSAAVGLLR